tara:strand:- start:5212 stop:5829 length:618 start_codon:yes stop_codon:yes gene_type:complete
MKFIPLNDEILEILKRYADWFFEQDLTQLYTDSDTTHTQESACSKEYLKEVMSKQMGKERGEHWGPPETVHNTFFGPGSKCPQEHKDASNKVNDELVKYLSALYSAVHVYYPEGGFMGWHNNWDVPGYNILINYNAGDGWFKYYDIEKDEIITQVDPVGWSAKVGYYGGKDDPTWHCAGGGPRITFGFLCPVKEMWEMMIEDLSS